ncbi:hypothetical protein MMC30_000797 [Trapelia coarctata]|nr:hypothetical protein [Trapelia coarctata]
MAGLIDFSGPMDYLSNEELDKYLSTAANWTEDDLNTLSTGLPSRWETMSPEEWYAEYLNLPPSLDDPALLLPLNDPIPLLPLDDPMDGIVNGSWESMIDADLPAVIRSAESSSDDREHGTMRSYSVPSMIPLMSTQALMKGEILEDPELQAIMEIADSNISSQTAQGGRRDDSLLRYGGTVTRRRIKPSEWDEKRDLIMNLYIDQEKSLPATRAMMAKDYGFYASEKAYKDKIREWKLVKNLKKRQIIYMLKVARKRRDEEGKETTFFYRGNRVPEGKLRRYSRAVSTNSTIRSVPSQVDFITPRNSQILNTEKQVLSESHKYSRQEQLQTNFLVIPNVTDIDIGKTQAFLHLKSRLVDQFFYPTIPLQNKRPRISLSHAEFAVEVVTALRNFAKQCEAGGIKPALLAEYILSPSFGHEIQTLEKDIGFQSRRVFALPLRTWQAQCLIAAHRFSEGEVFLDAILSEYEHTSILGREGHLKDTFPVLMSVGKAYLAQQKYYTLEKVLQSALRTTNDLGDPCKKDTLREKLSLRKMLYIGRMYRIRAVIPFDRSYTAQSKAYGLDTMLAKDLTSAKGNAEIGNSLWALSILDTLRYRYSRDLPQSIAPLTEVLSEMRYVAQPSLTEAPGKKNTGSTGDDKRFQADFNALCSISFRMLESYRAVGMGEEAMQWEQLLQNVCAIPRASSDSPATGNSLASFTNFEYAIEVLGPLFRRFLGEWPSIELPVILEAERGNFPF